MVLDIGNDNNNNHHTILCLVYNNLHAFRYSMNDVCMYGTGVGCLGGGSPGASPERRARPGT